MSRSRAKKYRSLDNVSGMKRIANKKVRRTKDFDVDGNSFKKLFSTWNINDGPKAKPIPPGPEAWKQRVKRK